MTDDQIDRLVSVFADMTVAFNRLGINNAATDMGAIECLSKNIGDGLNSVTGSIETLAESIETLAEATEHVADAIKDLNDIKP